jgi:anti-sigma factor RsiW
MDYVDGDLSGKLRSDFLAHALNCPECERELKEIQHVRKLLANLTPATASSEFDFKLKSRLNRERTLLLSPFYRMRLYISDNIQAFITVPAVAMLLLAGFFFYPGNGLIQNQSVRVTNQISPDKGAPAVQSFAGASDEDVYYVLDPLDSDKVGNGAAAQSASRPRTRTNDTVTLISF